MEERCIGDQHVIIQNPGSSARTCGLPGSLVSDYLSNSTVSTEEFRRLNIKLNGRVYWGRFMGGSYLNSINPIQLIGRDVFLAKRFMDGVTIAVVGAEHEGGRGFVILALTMPPRLTQFGAAGDLIRQKCSLDPVDARSSQKPD